MYTVAPTKKPKFQPTMFHVAGTDETTPHFIQGSTTCKSCKSLELDHYPPVDDAKCKICGQWQNEELLPH